VKDISVRIHYLERPAAMCHNAEMDLEGTDFGNWGAKFSNATKACDTAEGLVNAMLISWLDNCREYLGHCSTSHLCEENFAYWIKLAFVYSRQRK
jgi:hypothetical protein